MADARPAGTRKLCFAEVYTGKSKGGRSTRILARTDWPGSSFRFALLPGHRDDTVGVAPLIPDRSFDARLADKAFGVTKRCPSLRLLAL